MAMMSSWVSHSTFLVFSFLLYLRHPSFCDISYQEPDRPRTSNVLLTGNTSTTVNCVQFTRGIVTGRLCVANFSPSHNIYLCATGFLPFPHKVLIFLLRVFPIIDLFVSSLLVFSGGFEGLAA